MCGTTVASASAIPTAWVEPAGCPDLNADTVHVWRIPLVVPDADQAERTAGLAPDERKRAARFHFERGRLRWIGARGAVRALHRRPGHRRAGAARLLAMERLTVVRIGKDICESR